MNRDELRSKIEHRVLCEEKAHKCVENLVLNSNVSKLVLEDAVNQMMPGHYADVIEERSISKLCGYPLCQNELIKIPKQNVHISLQQKRIYDITERKLFCSNFCYKASKYLESQIPRSPLWLRKGRVVNIELLEDTGNPTGCTYPRKEHSTSTDIESSCPLEDLTIEETERMQDTSHIVKRIKDESESSFCHPEEKSQISSSKICVKETGILSNTENIVQSYSERTVSSSVVDIDKLCSYLKEWCTNDTLKILSVSSKIEKGSHNLGNYNSNQEGQLQSKKYDAEKMKGSAKKFLEANIEWQSEAAIGNDRFLGSEAAITPPIDSKSQKAIRRRIVSQKLKNGFSEVLSDYQISVADFKVDITSLIRSFRLTNQNISLRAKEWKLIAAALLHGFAYQDKFISSLLETNHGQTEQILKVCCISKDQFNNLTQILKEALDDQKLSNSNNVPGDHDNYNNEILD